MDWYVAKVKPLSERDAIADLAGQGLVTFMPVCRIDVFDRRKRKSSIRVFPLINGYVFTGFGGAIDFAALHRSDLVTGILGRDGVPQRVPEREIQALMDGQARGEFDRDANGRLIAEIKKNKGLRPDDRIRIETGPFTGFYGTVTKPAGKKLVAAMLDIFGRMTPVEFALDQVKKVA